MDDNLSLLGGLPPGGGWVELNRFVVVVWQTVNLADTFLGYWYIVVGLGSIAFWFLISIVALGHDLYPSIFYSVWNKHWKKQTVETVYEEAETIFVQFFEKSLTIGL